MPEPELLSPAGLLCTLLIFAYAEVHYRFRFIPSRYFMRAPEIIADVPTRLAPGSALPVLLLIKDAHHYPVRLERVEVTLRPVSGPARTQAFVFNTLIDQPWWHRVLWLRRRSDETGRHEITVRIFVQLRNRRQVICADNYRLCNHRPFRCEFAGEPLPGGHDFYTGDLHTHSNYTSDQVEFGAPVPALARLAKAMGLDFLAVTDHSYDLDDDPENYLANDSELRKWKRFLQESAASNRELRDFVLLPGEEVSCGNARGQNVHFLVLNNPDYLPGAGDSGEKWLRTAPDLTVADVMRRTAASALHFAAHPETPVPLLQRLLLRRNIWRRPDYRHDGLHGLQIWNGHPAGTQAARQSWIDLLLRGRRQFIIAGSDAHGNFNRFRQIGMPHLSMREHNNHHLLGRHRTTAYLPDGLSLERLTQALRAGACFITAGPFLALAGHQAGRVAIPLGGTLTGWPARLEITAHSSAETGALQRVVLYRGVPGTERETTVFAESLPTGAHAFRTVIDLPPPPAAGCYYRAEAYGGTPAPLPLAAMTNPVWHRP